MVNHLTVIQNNNIALNKTIEQNGKKQIYFFDISIRDYALITFLIRKVYKYCQSAILL